MTTIADTASVLARAAVFDQRLARPSTTVIAAWSEEFSRHDLDLPDLLAGVSAYYATGRDRVVQVGDVIAAARDARQRRAHTEAVEQARALPPGQPPRLGADGGFNADGNPVHDAYAIDGARNLPCTYCHAQPGQWCTNPRTGKTAKIPHLARLRDARAHTRQPRRDTT